MLGGAGAFAYIKLGRAEDPSFTIKTAIVSAAWPGATAQEMQFQVADRIEKKLQELPWFDTVKTYSKPGIVAGPARIPRQHAARPGAVAVLPGAAGKWRT